MKFPIYGKLNVPTPQPVKYRWEIDNLVGGFKHFEKYESQWEGLSHI
jgi:hypothetical protein